MPSPKIEFTTSCYEKDWQLLLKTDRLQLMVEACKYSFSAVKVYINNVENFEAVAKVCEELKLAGVIDGYIRVADHEAEICQHYNIEKDQPGYYYMVQFLTMIHLSEGDYHLNFTADAILTNSVEWIVPAMDLMQSDEKIIVANALFDGKKHQAMRESFTEKSNFYISCGFSDQCFLINPEFFRHIDYNEENNSSDFYPHESRDSFEESVYRFMRNHGYLRATHKTAEYRHKNFPKGKIKTSLALNTTFNNKKYGIKRSKKS